MRTFAVKTKNAKKESASILTATQTTETDVKLSELLEEFENIKRRRADLKDEDAKLTTQKAELKAVLLKIKTDNNFTFEVKD